MSKVIFEEGSLRVARFWVDKERKFRYSIQVEPAVGLPSKVMYDLAQAIVADAFELASKYGVIPR